MISRSLLILLTLATASCIPIVGDGYVRVRGTAIDQNGRPFDDCEAILHRSNVEAFQGPRRTKGDFQEGFVIEPRPREYYVSVTCTGAQSVAKSAIFRAGTPEQSERPVDLGNLRLTRAGAT
jgi:hypothetical protein